MLYGIDGVVREFFEETVLIQVNNIFLEAFPSKKVLEIKKGTEVFLYTYLDITEWNLNLFVFKERIEKDIFLKLIKVSKLGPKGASKILRNTDAQDLAFMIANEDVKGLSSIPGVGKKTAERIINELKDEMTKFALASKSKEKEKLQEVLDAMEALGFERNSILKKLKEIDIKSNTVEEIIKQLLKKL